LTARAHDRAVAELDEPAAELVIVRVDKTLAGCAGRRLVVCRFTTLGRQGRLLSTWEL
jgi:hypothetical protein